MQVMTEMLRGSPKVGGSFSPTQHCTDPAWSKAAQQLQVHLIPAVSSPPFPILLIRKVKSLAETLVKFTLPASVQPALGMTCYPLILGGGLEWPLFTVNAHK